MVESSNSSFMKLSFLEGQKKLSKYLNVGLDVRLWKKGHSSKLFTISSIYFDDCNSTYFQLKNFKIMDIAIFANSDLFMHFVLNSVSYLVKVVIEKKDGKRVLLKSTSELYRNEKRVNERLLSYPLYKFYVYLNITNNRSNILSMNRITSKKCGPLHQFLQDFSKENNNKGTGFRIIDISKTGFSFMANENEKSIFETGTDLVNLTLEVKDKEYSIKKANVAYCIDYVDKRFAGVSMYKVGIKLHMLCRELNEVIDSLLSRNLLDEESIHGDFEDFYNKE